VLLSIYTVRGILGVVLDDAEGAELILVDFQKLQSVFSLGTLRNSPSDYVVYCIQQ
jgi:hypothetical protein